MLAAAILADHEFPAIQVPVSFGFRDSPTDQGKAARRRCHLPRRPSRRRGAFPENHEGLGCIDIQVSVAARAEFCR
jgi:hypothetical protein